MVDVADTVDVTVEVVVTLADAVTETVGVVLTVAMLVLRISLAKLFTSRSFLLRRYGVFAGRPDLHGARSRRGQQEGSAVGGCLIRSGGGVRRDNLHSSLGVSEFNRGEVTFRCGKRTAVRQLSGLHSSLLRRDAEAVATKIARSQTRTMIGNS